MHSPSQEAPAERGWLGLACALGAFAALVAHTNFLIDDAYISFRYARNWAEHGVPAFHLPVDGAGKPVEGYSNFLWVALLRFWAGSNLEVVARVISVACGALLLVSVHRFVLRDLRAGALAAGLGSLLLATFPPFVTWCTGGLEGALFALLLFAAFRALLAPEGNSRAGLRAGWLGVGIVLVRTEGFLWVLALAAIVWVAGSRCRRRLAAFLGLSALGFGLFLLWRHSVYGEWIGNTAYAKAAFSGAVVLRGAKTVATFLVLFVTPIAALCAWPFALASMPKSGGERRAGWAAGGMLIAFLGYNVLVGGDWMPMFRFLAPAAPFLAILLGLGLARMARPAALGLGALALALQLLPAFGLSLAPRALLEPLYFRGFRGGYQTELQRLEIAERNRAGFRRIGRALAQVAREEDSLTLGPIGAIGFFSGMRLHDRNGLVDREVARREADAGEHGSATAGHDRRVARAWFLPREPTFFDALVWPSSITAAEWPGLDAAARSMMSAIQSDPAERPLLERSVAEAYPLEAADGIPAGAMLLVLRAAEPAEARAFWSRVLAGR